MKQKAISLSLSFFIHKNSKKRGHCFGQKAVYLGMMGWREWENGETLSVLPTSLWAVKSFQGSREYCCSRSSHTFKDPPVPLFHFHLFYLPLFIFSSSTPSVTVLLKLNEHVCTHFFFQLYHCFITNYLSFVTVSKIPKTNIQKHPSYARLCPKPYSFVFVLHENQVMLMSLFQGFVQSSDFHLWVETVYSYASASCLGMTVLWAKG